MTETLSDIKVSKMFALHFAGYSQLEIAGKLKISQAIVSIYITKFKAAAAQYGLKAAAQEVGVMDQVEALHSLSVELKKAKLTVEEAKVGLQMVLLFEEYGIKQEDYPDIIEASTKMNDEGFTSSAIKLNQLKKDTGLEYEEIYTNAANTHQQLEQTQAQVASITDKLKSSKEQLAAIDNDKKQASQNLAAHMKQVGVDMNRLALVEDLAIALKEGSLPDADLGQYIKRQKHLNQAGISLDNLITIVKQAKVMTADDGGKALAEKLSQFGSLDVAIEARQNKLGLLTKETAGLEEKAKLKAKIETDIVKLKAERAAHESVLAELVAGEKKLAKAQHDVIDLLHEQETLVQDIKQKEERRGHLDEEIADKEQKVSDLSELEAKRDAASATLAELGAKKKLEVMEREVFESFLGVVASSLSLEAMEKFVALAPQLIAFGKQAQYSPELLRSVIIKGLSGGTLEILRCRSCQARFNVDKPAQHFDTRHHCPLCGSYLVETDVNGPEIIKKALTALAPRVIVATVAADPKGAPPKNPGQTVSHG